MARIGPHRLLVFDWSVWPSGVGKRLGRRTQVISPLPAVSACLSWERRDWGSSQPYGKVAAVLPSRLVVWATAETAAVVQA